MGFHKTMREIYESVMAALQQRVPELRWIDFNLGQFRSDPPPVSWPCALIDLSTGADYVPVSRTQSTGEVIIEVAIGFRLRERTHNIANAPYRDEALAHVDVVEKVREALRHAEGSMFTRPEFQSFSREQRADLRVWTLRFATTHTTTPDPSPYQPWPGPSAGPDFCVHPSINN